MQIDPTKLITARLQRAMSQEEASIACDLSARTIQRIEAGHTASLESTKALLTIFGANIIYDPAQTAPSELQLSSWQFVATRVSRSFRPVMDMCFDSLRIALAAVLALIAVAKPFVPGRTGLFMDRHFQGFGVLGGLPAGSHDVLGY